MANDIYKVSIEYESKDFTRAIQEYERFVQTTQQGTTSENTAARASDNNTRSKRNLTRATRDLNSAQQRARQQFLATANSIAVLDGPLGGIASRFSAFGVLIGRIGIPLAAAAISFSTFTFTAARAVRQFSEWEVSLSTVENRLNSVSNQVNLTSSDISNLAQTIALETLAAEDQVLQTSSALLTFRNISTDMFEGILRAAQDLSASGFGDLQSSALRLAKAIEDPRQSLTALSRAGITFTRQQRQLILSLRDAGREAEAYGVIMETVERQVSGAGRAQSDTLAGSFDTIGQGVRGATRALGQWVAELRLVEAGINRASRAAEGFTRRRLLEDTTRGDRAAEIVLGFSPEAFDREYRRIIQIAEDRGADLSNIMDRFFTTTSGRRGTRTRFGGDFEGLQRALADLFNTLVTEEQRAGDAAREYTSQLERRAENLADIQMQIDMQRELVGLTEEEARARRILNEAGLGRGAQEAIQSEIEGLEQSIEILRGAGEDVSELVSRLGELRSALSTTGQAGNDLRRVFEDQRIAREINRIEESTQNTNEVLRVQVRILEEARAAGNNALTVTEARRQAELQIQRQMIETRAAIVAAAGATALLTGSFREAAQAAAEVARLANLIKEIEQGSALQLRVGELGRPDRAGGSGEDPNAQYIQELEALQNYLERRREEMLIARGFERELVIEQYDQRYQILRDALDRNLITHQDYSERLAQLIKSREDRISEIERAAQAQRMGDAAGFFGSLAGIAQAGGDRFVRAVAAFRGAEAVINAWSAYSQVLADPAFIGRPWARAAAAANVLGAGLQAVSNIRNAGRGGAVGSGSARAPRERRELSPQRVMIQGLDPNALFSGQQLQNLFDSLLDENDNRGRVFVVAR